MRLEWVSRADFGRDGNDASVSVLRILRVARTTRVLRAFKRACDAQCFFMMLDLHVFGRARLAPRLHWLAPAQHPLALREFRMDTLFIWLLLVLALLELLHP